MRISIIGATGLVGHELIDLVRRAWPDSEILLYASKAQQTIHADAVLPVAAAEDLERPDTARGDLAFVALDDDHSARYVPRLLALGYRVIDKSSTYRGDANVPLVVAGVNCHLVGEVARLVANPNCTTIPLVMCLSIFQQKWGLEDVTVSTYQAVSGAGKATLVDFLAAANVGYADMASQGDFLGQVFDECGYAGNVVPHNAKTDETGFSSEERKLVQESKKILAQNNLSIAVQCCRVPIAVGHYQNVWIRLRIKAGVSEIENALRAAEGKWIKYIPGASGDGLSSLASLRERDRALVGRIRRDPRDSDNRAFCLTIVADNIRLGAATNAVRVASRWFGANDTNLHYAMA